VSSLLNFHGLLIELLIHLCCSALCHLWPCVTRIAIMESKSARRRSRQANSSACEEVSIGQQSFDKVLRLEGRLGTLHEKFIESTNEMVELRDRIDVLQKILLFIDVDKLNVAIKALKIDAVAEVDECFDLNVAIKALKIDAVAEVDPCFDTPPKPLKLQLDNIITPEKPRTLLQPCLGHSELKIVALDKLLETSSISSSEQVDAKICDVDDKLVELSSVASTEDDDDGATMASITNQDFEEKPLGCMPPGLEVSDGFKTGIVNYGFPKEFRAAPVQFKIGIEQLNDSLADEYGYVIDPSEVWHDLCQDADDEVCSLVVKDFIARLDPRARNNC